MLFGLLLLVFVEPIFEERFERDVEASGDNGRPRVSSPLSVPPPGTIIQVRCRWWMWSSFKPRFRYIGRYLIMSKWALDNAFAHKRMVIYSIKDLMGLCTDYALDAQIQKILFSFDLWIPKAAREVHIDNVTQQRHATAAFTGFCRARSPTGNDSTNNSNNITNRLRRPFALRSMSAEVFRSSIDTAIRV
ncbi:unnamed protein product [Rotaria socialis]|uniref:Uncharacterized protein n=1 Tax=Rotaria socialis TaxID=392032 RepID=A0A818TRE0_9BILA|nr:unnamed protein product [Rotaria socialis]CAF4611231.1 unnamed protein product [Rotaria socialis]